MNTKTYHSELKTALEADLHFDTTVMAGALAEWDQLQSQHAELLAALESLWQFTDPFEISEELTTQVKAAIAKARGEA